MNYCAISFSLGAFDLPARVARTARARVRFSRTSSKRHNWSRSKQPAWLAEVVYLSRTTRFASHGNMAIHVDLASGKLVCTESAVDAYLLISKVSSALRVPMWHGMVSHSSLHSVFLISAQARKLAQVTWTRVATPDCKSNAPMPPQKSNTLSQYLFTHHLSICTIKFELVRTFGSGGAIDKLFQFDLCPLITYLRYY